MRIANVLGRRSRSQTRLALLCLFVLLPATAQCRRQGHPTTVHSAGNMKIYRMPRSHRFVIAYDATEWEPPVFLGAGTLKKADLHVVGCDADSMAVKELALIPFRALDSGKFGFRLH